MQVPPEIIDRIFAFLEPGLDQSMPFTPQWLLCPLLLVCKEWHVVAQRRLYSSVSLGDGWTSGGGEEICAKFYESIEENPHLAALVQELRLGSYDSSNTGEETLHHARILRLCENAERVEIVGFNNTHREELKDVLLRRDLVELTISRAGLSDRTPTSLPEDTSFCTLSEMIAYISHCPRLRKLSTTDAFHHFDDESFLPDPSSVRGCCPNLREITIEDDALSPRYLLTLSEMAPNVEKFHFDSKGIDAGMVQSCLRSWSSTLSYLFLRSNDTCSVAKTCTGLRGLRNLAVRSVHLPPDVLVNFSELETLMYFCESNSEHLEQLVSILQDSNALPSLRQLCFDLDRGLRSGNIIQRLLRNRRAQIAIDNACKARGIRVEVC